jgi:hypothetical protein
VALHGAVGPAHDREVARALAEKISVGEKEALGMRLGNLQACEELRVLQAGGVMAQVRACVERGAELGESPALDEPDLGLRYVAACELLQEIA